MFQICKKIKVVRVAVLKWHQEMLRLQQLEMDRIWSKLGFILDQPLARISSLSELIYYPSWMVFSPSKSLIGGNVPDALG